MRREHDGFTTTPSQLLVSERVRRSASYRIGDTCVRHDCDENGADMSVDDGAGRDSSEFSPARTILPRRLDNQRGSASRLNRTHVRESRV